jgi:hypothetical protein
MEYRPWEYGQQLDRSNSYFNNIRTTANGSMSPVDGIPAPSYDGYTSDGITDYGNPGVQPGGQNIDQYTVPLINGIVGLGSGFLNGVVPGLGFAVNQGYQALSNPNYGWNDLARNGLGGILGYFLGGQNLGSQITSNPWGQMAAEKGIGMAGNSLLNMALNAVMGRSNSGQHHNPNSNGTGEEGWGYQPNFGFNTIGNFSEDPALANYANIAYTPVGPMAMGSADQPGTYLGGWNPFGTYGGTENDATYVGGNEGNPGTVNIGDNNGGPGYGGDPGNGDEAGWY